MNSSPSQFATRGKSGAILWVCGLLALALAVRLAAAWWWQMRLGDALFGFGDSDSYWHLAEDLARGREYGYGSARVFRAPGYPLLLAPLFWIWPSPPVMAARILNCVLGLVPVGVAIMMTRRLQAGEDRSTSLFAGLLAAIYPGAIAMSVFVLSEAPFAPLMMLQLYCALRLADATADRVLWWALLVGTTGGLATLVRPSWLLFTPALALLELMRRRCSLAAWQAGLAMGLGLCLVMSPWWIRNYQVTGAFIPTTLQIGASLMDGLGPQADGSSNMKFADDAYAALVAEDRKTGADPATFEIRLNQKLRDQSLNWAKQHPRRVLGLAWVKFKRIWNPWPNNQQFQSPKLRWLIAAGYIPLLAAAIVGLFLLWRQSAVWTLVLPALYLTSLHVIFVGSIRYRQPAILALTPVAAIGICGLCRRLRAGEGSELAAKQRSSTMDSRGTS